MNQKRVTLPELPLGKEYEEFLAAYLQCSGLYVERSIIDRQEEEVLELDIITTEYQANAMPINKLIEVKSGGWGFPDLFKIRGWLDYININSGALLVKEPKESQDFYSNIASNLHINLLAIPDKNSAVLALAPITNSHQPDSRDIAIWRFSYWIERQLLKRLTQKKKSVKDKQCYSTLDKYHSLIHNQIFFTENIVDRIDKLYSNFKDFPSISSKMGHELLGESFDEEHERIPECFFNEAYYACQINDLAISTYVEHKSRLAVMKAAIDYKICKNIIGDPSKKIHIEFGTYTNDISFFDLLPESFRSGLNELTSHQYCHRYPVFWQWFIWFMGGFILDDYREQELKFLSDRCGIPVSHIEEALQSYDLLFPQTGGWFITQKHSATTNMKLIPLPYLGLGAHLRKLLYSSDLTFNNLAVTGRHTRNDLIKWNNAFVELLA